LWQERQFFDKIGKISVAKLTGSLRSRGVMAIGFGSSDAAGSAALAGERFRHISAIADNGTITVATNP
jgi:hypothetical protein